MAPVVAIEPRRAALLDCLRRMRKIEAPALFGRVEPRPEEVGKQMVGVQGRTHGGNIAQLCESHERHLLFYLSLYTLRLLV